ASGYSLKTDAVFLSTMAAAIPKSPGQAWGKNGFFLSPTSARCPVSAVQPSVQSPQAFDPAETGQNRREYPRQFAPKPQPDRRIGVLFLCPHSFVMPRAPPIHHETIFREYRDALHLGHAPRARAFSERRSPSRWYLERGGGASGSVRNRPTPSAPRRRPCLRMSRRGCDRHRRYRRGRRWARICWHA
ncbi:MAG: hypothetical protein RL077_1499, partial [Verrucomicrobiota bacterium]